MPIRDADPAPGADAPGTQAIAGSSTDVRPSQAPARPSKAPARPSKAPARPSQAPPRPSKAAPKPSQTKPKLSQAKAVPAPPISVRVKKNTIAKTGKTQKKSNTTHAPITIMEECVPVAAIETRGRTMEREPQKRKASRSVARGKSGNSSSHGRTLGKWSMVN